MQFFQKVFSMRIKAVYNINSPSFINTVIMILKTIMKPKLFERVISQFSLSYIIYQGTDILPEIFSSSPHTRVFVLVARKLHEGVSPRVILSDKHECWTARKNFR
jgi:hypothetical protein